MGKLKEKLENFWYYYKWHTLIAVFFIFVIVVMITQMVGREEHDIKILYAGPYMISDNASNELASTVEQLMPKDCDGDGEKNAAINHILIMTDEELKAAYDTGYSAFLLNAEKMNDNRDTLTAYAYAGDFLIFFLDERLYIPLRDAGAFVALDDFGITKGQRYDEYAVYLDSLEAAKFFTCFQGFPEDTVVALRRIVADKNGVSREEDVKSQQDHMEFFKALTEFVSPEASAE